MNPTKQIDEMLFEARRLALEWVENEARRLLKQNSWLTEFIMAMGGATFRTREDRLLDVDMVTIADDLADFIRKFDDSLGITGEPMRFTKDGPKITVW